MDNILLNFVFLATSENSLHKTVLEAFEHHLDRSFLLLNQIKLFLTTLFKK